MRCRIFKRKTGVWYTDHTDARTGKRIKAAVGPSKAEAQDVLAKIRTEMIEKGYFEKKREPRVLYENFVKTYMEWAWASKKSAREDERFLRLAARDFQGKLLCKITPAMVEAYRIRRSAEKVAYADRQLTPRQIQYEMAILKGFFSKAQQYGAVAHNPVKEIKMPRVSSGRIRYLQPHEIDALLRACDHGPKFLTNMIVFALELGMRSGEILGLRWDDVDFGNGVVHIREAKSGKARSIALNDASRGALRGQMSINNVVNRGEGYVFGKEDGTKRLSTRNAFESAVKRAGLKDVVFHTCRHTTATTLINDGVPVTTVMQMLGHRALATTMKYYHAAPQQVRLAMQRPHQVTGKVEDSMSGDTEKTDRQITTAADTD